jgi:hypothetical protein
LGKFCWPNIDSNQNHFPRSLYTSTWQIGIPVRLTRIAQPAGLGTSLRLIVRLLLVLALTVGAVDAKAQELRGSWLLRIENLERKEVASLTLQFTNSAAPSCIGGNWRRVIVKESKTTDKKFFPISDPLSYQIEGSVLTIGRNGVCDAYLHLSGKWDAGTAQGTYNEFGLRSGSQLGYFSLKQIP